MESYLGLDLSVSRGAGVRPDLEWDCSEIPMNDASVDCVLLMEVLEHCTEPGNVLKRSSEYCDQAASFF